MKKRKSQKNRRFLPVCAASILLTLGMITGCSVSESVPSEPQTTASLEQNQEVSNQSENENKQLESMTGKWTIDFDKTDASLWGSGISLGNEMEISPTGNFSYFIGIGVGGTGQCEDNNNEITVEIQPYEEHSSEKETLTLKYVNDKEEEYILMNWHDENVYWKRNSATSSDNPPADDDTLESDISHTPEDILSSDAQGIKKIVEKFAAAYFNGDRDTVQDCLTNPYEWEIEVYTGEETISNYTIKGLTADIDGEEIDNSKVVSIEYKKSENDDTFQYLTLELVKQEDDWKIQFYGIE